MKLHKPNVAIVSKDEGVPTDLEAVLHLRIPAKAGIQFCHLFLPQQNHAKVGQPFPVDRNK